MFKALIIFGIVWVICGLGLGVVTYISMREEIEIKKKRITAYEDLVKLQDELIIALRKHVDTLNEKIQIMEEGAESEQL